MLLVLYFFSSKQVACKVQLYAMQLIRTLCHELALFLNFVLIKPLQTGGLISKKFNKFIGPLHFTIVKSMVIITGWG